MNKQNKLKKGIIKVFDFTKSCECLKSNSYEKLVASQKFELCVLCDCVKKNKDDIAIQKHIERMVESFAKGDEEADEKISRRKVINLQKKKIRESFLTMLEDAKSNNEWVVPNRLVA